MLKCKNCGADIPFVPETQSYICPYCGTEYTHDELSDKEKEGEIKAEERVIAEQIADDADSSYIKVITYTCPQCGGELYTTDDTAATFCSYCGASVLLEKRVSREQKPEYIIPFQVTKEEAAEKYKEKLKRAIFAPSYIKNMDIEKVRGIYMPYWTYQAYMDKVPIEIEQESYRPAAGGKYVDVYGIEGQVTYTGAGLEYDSATTFPDDLSQRIAPYHFDKKLPYAASYMSGFYADAGDVDAGEYAEEAIGTYTDVVKDKLQERYNMSFNQAVHSQIIEKNLAVGGERAMYPVWFIAARDPKRNRVSYGAVNGQTGKVAADVPVDSKKLLIGTLLLAIPIFLILFALFTPTPHATVGVVAGLSVIGLFTSVVGIAGSGFFILKRYIWAILFGFIILLMSLSPTKVSTASLYGAILVSGVALLIQMTVSSVKILKRASSKKWNANKYLKTWLLNLTAVICCLVILIANPVDDIWYYLTVLIAVVLNAGSFLLMFKIRNNQMLRRLSQLGKRGGDGA